MKQSRKIKVGMVVNLFIKQLTLIDCNQKIGDDKKGKPMDTSHYQILVGKLIYSSHTWLDIVFVVK